jgi:hypothetical protein
MEVELTDYLCDLSYLKAGVVLRVVYEPGLGLRESGLVVASACSMSLAQSLELCWRDITERFMEPGRCKPGDPFDDRELELGACAPDVVAIRSAINESTKLSARALL